MDNKKKYTGGSYPILSKKSLAKNVYDYVIYCPEIAAMAKCGQFVNVKAEGFTLRRPISICGIDPEKGTIRIVFEVRGKGTEKMSEKNSGDMIDIIAPLGGRGFELLDPSKKALIIGGGIGNPPLLPIAKHYGANGTVISGFRNAAAVILEDDLRKSGAEYILCTDNGTAGRKGFVTDIAEELLSENNYDIAYACGPAVMLKKICEITKKHSVRCQVSMEERMGCGIGACLVCVCRTIRDGEEFYSHVCKDGPVFESTEVEF